MVHGFEPVEGLDYTETCVSMVKPMSCKAMYAIAAANNWDIEQMNAKAIFLYGHIEKNFYAFQSTGFWKGT
jgi:hypothetical protein